MDVQSDHDHFHRLQMPLGATGERTDLNRGPEATLLSGHARRSRDGGGDTTLDSQPSGDIRNRVSRRRPESATAFGRRHAASMGLSPRIHPEASGAGVSAPIRISDTNQPAPARLSEGVFADHAARSDSTDRVVSSVGEPEGSVPSCRDPGWLADARICELRTWPVVLIRPIERPS